MNLRSLTCRPATAIVVSFAIAAPAMAQQRAEAPPPPQLEQLEEGEPPAVTIRQPDREQRVNEKRAPGGKVTEVRVTGRAGTYILKANDQHGSALPGDQQAQSMRAAQWEVMEFDLSRSQETKDVATADTPQPPSADPAQDK